MMDKVITNKACDVFSQSDFDVIEFSNGISSRIQVRPIYFELGFSQTPRMFGRRAVFDRLTHALQILPQSYGFLIWDVYRPRVVQGKLFNWMREEVRKRSPHLSEQENIDETKKYMSAPSKIGEEYCPPHLSGGAIDLTLFESRTNTELEMGTPFDDCTERAHSDYFDKQIQLTTRDKIIKERRDLLRTVMEKVGFVSYQYEWWHFDIGDIFWSRITENPAVFGPLFGDAEWISDE